MQSITHLATGLALGKIIYQTTPDPLDTKLLPILGVSTVLSILPDINLFWHKKIKTHHNSLTHYPLTWIGLTIFVAAIEFFLQSQNFILTKLIFFNSLLHLFLDTFGFTIGVKWFWPISQKEYSFTKLHKDKINISLSGRVKHFFNSPFFIIEILIVTSCIVILAL